MRAVWIKAIIGMHAVYSNIVRHTGYVTDTMYTGGPMKNENIEQPAEKKVWRGPDLPFTGAWRRSP